MYIERGGSLRLQHVIQHNPFTSNLGDIVRANTTQCNRSHELADFEDQCLLSRLRRA